MEPSGACSASTTGDPQGAVDLRRRQPDAPVLVHGLDHVVDEALDLGGLDVLDRLGGNPQDRVAEDCDFQNGHGPTRSFPGVTVLP
jgi:hypothetical protein